MTNDLVDIVIGISIIIGLMIFLCCVLWYAITKDNHRTIYRVIEFTNNGPEVVKAGIFYPEAVELLDALKTKYPDNIYGLRYDNYAS